jgi:hypothetical protein
LASVRAAGAWRQVVVDAHEDHAVGADAAEDVGAAQHLDEPAALLLLVVAVAGQRVADRGERRLPRGDGVGVLVLVDRRGDLEALFRQNFADAGGDGLAVE